MTETTQARPRTSTRRVDMRVLLVSLMVALIVIKLAWIADDASITARVIANFLAGEGPNFNITERAQAITHPLWFLSVSAMSAIGLDVLVAMTVLGVSCTIAVVWLATRDSGLWGAIAFGVLFVFSYTLVDFGASGLENPMAWMFVTCMWVAARKESPYWAATAAGLAMLTRLDLAVVVVPFMIIWLVIRRVPVRRSAVAALMLAPASLWGLLAWSYYGSPLPETFFAKLNAEIPQLDVIGRGFYYLYDLFRYDPFSGLIILVGAQLAIKGLVSLESRILVAAGAGMYGAYVIWIGGDFMSGRMWSVPILCSLIVVAEWVSTLDLRALMSRREFLFALAIPFALLPLLVPWQTIPVLRSPIATSSRGNDIGARNAGIMDEWGHYARDGRTVALWVTGQSETLESMSQMLQTWGRQVQASKVSEVRVKCGNVGFESIMAGPAVHYVVHCGLSDPFLARVTFDPLGEPWRIGHFWRDIPAGYLEALAFGDSSLIDRQYLDLFESTSMERRIADNWNTDVILPDPTKREY